jgi:hypothetical protein
LYDASVELLQAAAAAVATTPGGPIDFQAIWPGLPAYDCVPALFVHAGGPSVGDTYPLQPPLQPMQRIVTSGLVLLIQLTITVLRCVPVIEQEQQSVLLPNPGLISQAAYETMSDVWAIWNVLIDMHRDGSLFQTPSGRREFILDPAVPVRTSGGAGGWEIPVRVQLGGY